MIKNARLIVGGESFPVASVSFSSTGDINSLTVRVNDEWETYYDGEQGVNFREHFKFEQSNNSAVSELYALVVESESELKLLAAKAIPSYGEQVSEVAYLKRCGDYHNKCAYIDGLYEALDVLKNV